MNKITLKFDLDLDFRLVAITCPMRDYRLAYFINRHLGLDFVRASLDEEHQVELGKQGPTLVFSKFVYCDEELGVAYYLLSNKGYEGGYLIPEMKGTDFFLMVKDAFDEELFRKHVDVIKRIPLIVAASEIDPYKLKSKENLLF